MSKVVRATCKEGTVTADGVSVPAARILSEGVAESEGVLVLDEDRAEYIAKTSPDLKTTLQKISAALESIANALNSIDSAGYVIAVVGMATGTPSPPVAASAISQINSVKSDIDELMENLR